MNRLLRTPSFSPFWFWSGVLSGSLFWYALGRFYPTYQRWRSRRAERRQARTAARLDHLTARWRQRLELTLQGRHLAAPLFPLEHILVTPRVLVPPPAYVPEGEYRPDDIASLAVPYTPDFPELATLYRYPTLPLTAALQGGGHLLLVGRYGVGKSTALTYLALLAARRDKRIGALQNALPVLIHVADLPLPFPEEGDLLSAVAVAGSRGAPARLAKAFHAHLQRALQSGQVLLLVDGADEMAPTRQPALADFLARWMQAYPRSRVVAAASPEFTDGLQAIGLQPVALAPWSSTQAEVFLKRWGRAWQKFIAPQFAAAEGDQPEAVDQRVLNRWLLQPEVAYTPLELTLKAWAAYAGDILGPDFPASLLAYLRRALPEDEKSLPALEALALQLLMTNGDALSAREAGKAKDLWEEVEEVPEDETAEEKPAKGKKEKARPRVRRRLPALVESGILTEHQDALVGFAHPTLRDYLAARALAAEASESLLTRGEWWEGRTEALGFLGVLDGGHAVAEALLQDDDLVVHRRACAAGRALAYNERPAWQAEVLRYWAALLTDLATPLNLRARGVTILAMSGERGLGALFRKMMGHQDLTVRWLGALGAGAVRDAKAVEPLGQLLYDPSRTTQRAAALALVAIGTTEALEAVAALLLSGDDLQRRIAAEALANHPEEGYPTLQEAAAMEEDLRVRRAAVYGLARVPHAWAREILEDLQIKDSQWVVRDAAALVLEQGRKLPLGVPRPLLPLHEEPWLLSFAADRGMGVAPGKPALVMLHTVLQEGTPEQREAALARIPFFPQEDWAKDVYPLLYDRAGPLRDAALHALWLLSIAGVELPSPVQLGFG